MSHPVQTDSMERMVRVTWVLVVLAGVSGFAVGCASPGNPRPPSLKLPEQVTDLKANRIGDRVEISWTGPTRTTDGVDITFPYTAEICRDTPLPHRQSAHPVAVPCTPVQRFSGHPGPSTAIDPLPAELLAGSARPLVYRIRLLNPAGRAAEPAVAVIVAGGPAVVPVAGFRATASAQGVVLEWAGSPDPAFVEVARTLQGVAAKEKPATKPAGKESSFGKKKDPAAPVALRPSSPANGMVDPVALVGKTYTYRAQRVATVELEGEPVEARSEWTAPVTLTLRPVFAPAAPTGLVSIPGAIRVADQPGTPTIDLSWDANREPGVTGYVVYRVDLAAPNAQPERLNQEPLSAPAFRDARAQMGHRYRYRVTAVDQAGNESKASEAIEDSPVAP